MSELKFSKQQYKCLYFLSHGMTYKEIAREMDLSPRTVEYYMEAIRKKTNLNTKSQLVSLFLSQNYSAKQGMRLYA